MLQNSLSSPYGDVEYFRAIQGKDINMLRKVAENESFAHLEARALLMSFLAQESFQEDSESVGGGGGDNNINTESNEWMRWMRLVIIQYMMNGCDKEMISLFENPNLLNTGSSRFSLSDLAERVLVNTHVTKKLPIPPTLVFLLAVALEREGGQIEPIRKERAKPIELAIKLYKSIPEHGPSLYRLANLSLLSFDTGCRFRSHQYKGNVISGLSDKFDNPNYQAFHWISKGASVMNISSMNELSFLKISLIIEYINEIKNRFTMPTPTRLSSSISIPLQQSIYNDVEETKYYFKKLLKELEKLKKSFLKEEEDSLLYARSIIKTHKMIFDVDPLFLKSFNEFHQIEAIYHILKTKDTTFSYEIEELFNILKERISYEKFYNIISLNRNSDIKAKNVLNIWRKYRRGGNKKADQGDDQNEKEEEDELNSRKNDEEKEKVETNYEKIEKYIHKYIESINFEEIFDISYWVDKYEQYTNQIYGLLMMTMSWISLCLFRFTKRVYFKDQ